MKPNVIGGGWMDTSSSGEKYLRLSFKEGVRPKIIYTMFKNKNKSQDNSPDYLIYDVTRKDGPPEDDGFL